MSPDDTTRPVPDPRRRLRPETHAARAMGYVDARTGALVPPIHTSTTFERSADGSYPLGFDYVRGENPGHQQVEELLCELEGGQGAMLFSSGMSAATAVFCALRGGDHVVVPSVMYWGLRSWLNTFAAAWGIRVSSVDMRDLAAVKAVVEPGVTKVVWIETPANPTWDVTDISGIGQLAHANGARLAVDSTVATPVLTQPIELGADLVVHSATKALSGHSDVLAGAIVAAAADDPMAQRVRQWRAASGVVLSGFDAWLLLRGMRTLYPRVRQTSDAAMRLAEAFAGDPRVVEVLYPGLASHRGHDIAARQMAGGFGAMLSLRVAGGSSAAAAAAARCEVFVRATSLGGAESLVEHRASIEGPTSPVPDDLLRFSVGLEHIDDLLNDLDQALG